MTRLNPEEAGAYIGCRYDKLLQMVRKKQIPHYRVGNRVFFTKERLELWVKNLEEKSIQKE